MDLDLLKRNYSLSSVVGRYITLKKSGIHYEGVCPFHPDGRPSLKITDSKQIYKCFSCGAKGDIFQFLVDHLGITFREACEMIEKGSFDAGNPASELKPKKDKEDEYKPIIPAACKGDLPKAGKTFSVLNPNWIGHPKKEICKMKYDALHPYRGLSGQLHGFVGRKYFPLQKGEKKPSKFCPSILWCSRPDGSSGWTFHAFPEPRLPYRIELLRPDGREIYITMGEAKADILSEFPALSLSWSGGDGAVGKTDWTPVVNHPVIIWPDNDKSGFETANILAEVLDKLGCEKITILQPPPGKKKGWDAKDAVNEGWDKDAIKDLINKSGIIYPEKITYQEENAAQDSSLETEPTVAKNKRKSKESQFEDVAPPPFRILGYNRGIYYYLPREAQQSYPLKPGEHNEAYLQQLAKIEYWEENFTGSRGVDWARVRNYLYRECFAAGLFFPDREELGRGAWIVEKKKVFHLGDRVIVDGIEYNPFDVPLKKIFEKARPIEIPAAEPLTNKEAHQLIKLCERFSWINPLSGRLLAGWCVIAPICGILDWRPHIWITGGAHSGKTTALDLVIKKMTRYFNMSVSGETTESYIRQTIGKDAMPVLIDEAEAETKKAKSLMVSVLKYMRDSSSGGSLGKGGGNGIPISYTARSIFCFSSINPAVTEYAEQTRITKLLLKINKGQNFHDEFESFRNDLITTITAEFAAGMMLRSMQNIDVLLKNIETFTKGAMATLSAKRYADQLAPMLAGAYLCHSTKLVTLEEAKEWIANHDWGDHIATDQEKDADKLLSTILTYRTRFSDGKKLIDSTIGEMIIQPHGIDGIEQKIQLARYGIKVDTDRVYISNTASPIRNMILGETVWSSSWPQTLITLDGAEKIEKTTYFAPGIKSKAVSLPLTLIMDETLAVQKVQAPEEVDLDDYY